MSLESLSALDNQNFYPRILKPQPIRKRKLTEEKVKDFTAGFGADQNEELDREAFESNHLNLLEDDKRIQFEPLSLKRSKSSGPEFSLFDSSLLQNNIRVKFEEEIIPRKSTSVIDDFFAQTCIDEQFIPPIVNGAKVYNARRPTPNFLDPQNDIFATTRNVFPSGIIPPFEPAFSPESIFNQQDDARIYPELEDSHLILPPMKIKSEKKYVKTEHHHHGNYEFSCSICGKCYDFQSHLIRHERIHSGEKPYQCEVCGKNFSESSNLKTHMKRIHSASREFHCEMCGKCFAVNGDLTKHIRVHTKEKPFACKLCGRKFSDRSNLTQHTRIHSGSKPYECPTCKRCYSRRSSLSRHQGRVHMEGFSQFDGSSESD
jgi:hypothetical protein